jgi:hypothetical protein
MKSTRAGGLKESVTRTVSAEHEVVIDDPVVSLRMYIIHHFLAYFLYGPDNVRTPTVVG